jgi:hypothetical protein
MTTSDNFLAAYDKFKASIDAAYDDVRIALQEHRYKDAQDGLARIAQAHARTSVSMRNYLIKHGLMKGDE